MMLAIRRLYAGRGGRGAPRGPPPPPPPGAAGGGPSWSPPAAPPAPSAHGPRHLHLGERRAERGRAGAVGRRVATQQLDLDAVALGKAPAVAVQDEAERAPLVVLEPVGAAVDEPALARPRVDVPDAGVELAVAAADHRAAGDDRLADQGLTLGRRGQNGMARGVQRVRRAVRARAG